ncbi:hypothetical protein SAMN05216315_103118 [Nitrosospira sp. Nsp18]|uniref:hypothetical protein n=1 Tax=Nitrosospira sp. Nsp18 TaxID=1855334 RepID=UPI00088C5FCA|nr:hypothetical protein [Nitrosospira sp. Nsp18]SDA12525.1 hypothetical protein SAMN05216315_103118 [Nitrosospira sp. Nsp18]
MINGLGAFASGLAKGLGAGQDINLRRQYLREQKKSGLRKTELHQVKMEQAGFDSEKRNRLRNANDEIVAGWQRNQQDGTAQPLQSTAPGLSEISAQMPPAVDTRSAGLSGLNKPGARPTMSSDELIGMRMLTSNLPEDPNELTRMAGVYEKYGLLEEMAPWMNQVYAAKKSRIPDALHFLLSGDAKGAREVLEKGGVKLLADPLEIGGDNNIWKFRLEKGEEKNIELKNLAKKFFPTSIQTD